MFLYFIQTEVNTWIWDFNKGHPPRKSNNSFSGRPRWTLSRSAAAHTSLLMCNVVSRIPTRWVQSCALSPSRSLFKTWLAIRTCFAAWVTICAGFQSCCATGLFLDAAGPVMGLDPISGCLHLANRCPTKWTQFSEPLLCILSGDKDLYPRK